MIPEFENHRALEDVMMAHRYLYYVLGTPIIDDQTYDEWEKRALTVLPETSPLRQPGSDQADSYLRHIKELAESMYRTYYANTHLRQ